MRATGLTAAAAAIWALAASASQAQTTTAQLFSDQCLTGQAADQVAKARTAGFVIPPQSFMSNFPTEIASDATILWRTYDNGVDMLIVGRINPATNPLGPDLAGRICAVVSSPGQQDPEGELGKILGVAPVAAGDKKLFAYSEVDGKRTAMDPKATLTLSRAIEAGSLRVAIGLAEPNGKSAGEMMMVLIPLPK